MFEHAKQIKNNETYFEKGTGYKVIIDEYRFKRCPQCGKNRQRCTHQFKVAYNKSDEIMYESEIIVCMYSPNGNTVDTGIGIGYEYVQNYHEYSDKKPVALKKIERPVAQSEDVEKKIISADEIELINFIYREMRGLFHKYSGHYLYKEDRQDLLKRFMLLKDVEYLKKNDLWEDPLIRINKRKGKLTTNQLEVLKKREEAEKKIEKSCFFSVPSREKKVTYIEKDEQGSIVKKYQCKLQTAISKDLYLIVANYLKAKNKAQKVMAKEIETELLKVPGFVVAEDKKGLKYITFKHYKLQGYFVPYMNFNEKIEAMQIRLTTPFVDSDGKVMRYFWYSSDQASSGSPIDYYMPEGNLERYDVLLITEGATKMKVACEYLKFQGMGEAGVGNYRRLVKSILEYEKHMGVQFKIIIALDMDKNTIQDKEGRYPVMEAEKNTVELLKVTGHQIAIAEWDIKKGKGIDDALINGAKLKYKLV